MNQPWKVILAFVGVFMAGAVFGGFFSLRSAAPSVGSVGSVGVANPPRQNPVPRPMSLAPALLANIAQRLKLTDEQQEKIRPLVGRAEGDLQRLRRQNFQDTTRVMERLHADISGWLTVEQREDLQKMQRSMQTRMREGAEREKRGERFKGKEPAPSGPVEANAGRPKGN